MGCDGSPPSEGVSHPPGSTQQAVWKQPRGARQHQAANLTSSSASRSAGEGKLRSTGVRVACTAAEGAGLQPQPWDPQATRRAGVGREGRSQARGHASIVEPLCPVWCVLLGSRAAWPGRARPAQSCSKWRAAGMWGRAGLRPQGPPPGGGRWDGRWEGLQAPAPWASGGMGGMMRSGWSWGGARQGWGWECKLGPRRRGLRTPWLVWGQRSVLLLRCWADGGWTHKNTADWAAEIKT